MIERPLLVGMNNPYGADPRYALYPLPERSAGGRLYEIINAATGLSKRQYVRAYDRVNLVEGAWSAAVARGRADLLIPSLAGRRVVLLGRDVQGAFGIAGALPMEERTEAVSTGWITFYCVPHTSGRNLWYNDPENRRLAIEFFRRLRDLAGIELGELSEARGVTNALIGS